jgi:hypothetical protein
MTLSTYIPYPLIEISLPVFSFLIPSEILNLRLVDLGPKKKSEYVSPPLTFFR